VQQDVLAEMCRRLRHRGPDDSGWQVWNGVGLANTRLKVIDLSQNAHQPLSNEDGSVAVVLNGEIYNYRDLRDSLVRRGHCFRSSSDTEVIAHLYEELGRDCVSQLDGMFAFALWDEPKQELLLARDRTGKKPLFYHSGERLFVFASEIKALFAWSEVPRQMEAGELPLFLTLGYVPSPRTLYRGIRQVEPGTWLAIARDKQPHASRYWQFLLRAVPVSLPDAVSELRWRLEAAVRKRLIADVPLGAFLSGGLDSSIVVAIMSRLMPDAVRTFSIGFQGDSRFDERAFARLTATRNKTEHLEFVVGPQSVELVDALVRFYDQPFVDSSAIPTFLLSKLARAHVTVVLNGDGGDELFAGYRRLRLALAIEKVPGLLLRLGGLLAKCVQPISATAASDLRRLAACGRVKGALRLWASFPLFAAALPRLLRDSWALVDDTGELERHAGPLLRGSEGLSPLSRLLYCNFSDYLVNGLHVKMDRCTMANSLEARSPFLDTALIEFAATLPDDMKLCGGVAKRILRCAFRDLVPAPVLKRAKMGFGVPLSSWFRSDLRLYLQDVFLSSDARVYQFLDRTQVRKLIDSFLAGAQLWADAVWTLLTFESWLKEEARMGLLGSTGPPWSAATAPSRHPSPSSPG
jgi:asparagine synthase (glutamine-hydrolysing)